MMKSTLLTLIFLLHVPLLNAEAKIRTAKGVIYTSTQQISENEYTFQVIKENGDEILNIYNEEKKRIFTFQSNSVFGSFKRAHLLNLGPKKSPHLITIWGKGAHGEMMKIISLGKKPVEEFSTKSTWPIQFDYLNHSLSVKTFSEVKKNGKPKVKLEKFPN